MFRIRSIKMLLMRNKKKVFKNLKLCEEFAQCILAELSIWLFTVVG